LVTGTKQGTLATKL
ncbi:hypothetical protein Zm00014a_000530, partial [Zea mays]